MKVDFYIILRKPLTYAKHKRLHDKMSVTNHYIGPFKVQHHGLFTLLMPSCYYILYLLYVFLH